MHSEAVVLVDVTGFEVVMTDDEIVGLEVADVNDEGGMVDEIVVGRTDVLELELVTEEQILLVED